MARTDLQTLLEKLKRQYGNLSELARLLKMSPSRMSKLASGQGGSLTVINCLKLAEVTGESPASVLRAAKKADVAALIERLYQSTGREPTITPELQAVFERVSLTHTQIAELLDVWERLKADERVHWWELLKASAEEADRQRGVTNGPRPIGVVRDRDVHPATRQTSRRHKHRF